MRKLANQLSRHFFCEVANFIVLRTLSTLRTRNEYSLSVSLQRELGEYLAILVLIKYIEEDFRHKYVNIMAVLQIFTYVD